jgi:midasin (ATPase involved in ribosome maturation)
MKYPSIEETLDWLKKIWMRVRNRFMELHINDPLDELVEILEKRCKILNSFARITNTHTTISNLYICWRVGLYISPRDLFKWAEITLPKGNIKIRACRN